jgi:hypothetical protein
VGGKVRYTDRNVRNSQLSKESKEWKSSRDRWIPYGILEGIMQERKYQQIISKINE